LTPAELGLIDRALFELAVRLDDRGQSRDEAEALRAKIAGHLAVRPDGGAAGSDKNSGR
jgi:hypothetical protein